MEATSLRHDAAIEELSCYPHWVCWRREGKEKVPIDPKTGRKASTTDANTWATYEQTAAVADRYDGISYVVSSYDPFSFVDLDDCVDEYGEVATWALEVVEALDSYTEVSPSGKGLKIWIEAHKPGSRCRTGSIEVYDSRQFSTFTGKRFSGKGIERRQRELSFLYLDLFGTEEEDKHGVDKSGVGFGGGDNELLEKARTNAATGDAFRRLYDHGDIRGFRSHSEADLRLCTILAYWCGPDQERIDRLFRGSKLDRDKWDTGRGHGTYGEQTIIKGIEGCDYFYDPDYTRKSAAKLQKELRNVSAWLISQPWKGRSGPSERDTLKAMIRHAWTYGKVHAEGVEVCMSNRDIQLEASIGSNNTVTNALQSLEEKHGVVRRLDNGGARKASRFLLRRHEPAPYIQRVYKLDFSHYAA